MSLLFCEGLVLFWILVVFYVVVYDGSFEFKFGIEVFYRLGEKNEIVIVYFCVLDNNIKNFLYVFV